MKFTVAPVGDSNITIYNQDDGTPILIFEPDSYYVKDGEIRFDVDDETFNEIKEILGL
jgi:hypothetical protein